MSRCHPTVANERIAWPWLMCQAVLCVFTENCFCLKKVNGPHCLKYDRFLSSSGKCAAKYLSKQTDLFSWARS